MADSNVKAISVDESNHSNASLSEKEEGEKTVITASVDDVPANDDAASTRSADIPRKWRFMAVLLVTLIGFGSHWSSGVTGAMKSTLKKELHINNTQYALLDGSTDFMTTVLILFTGLVTDRIGGARAMLWGNVIYSAGAILIAAATTVRSYKFMIFGFIVQALGDIATQVAQYRVFSSWFAPSNGFASTLGFELGLGKIGSFVGTSTANVIAKGTGDFMWVYWTAVFVNLATNAATVVFWYFRKWCDKHYTGAKDPATGEVLKEKSDKRLSYRELIRVPWTTWTFVLFSVFETSTAIVFSANATELAEERLNVSSIKAGWYSAVTQYVGFFLVPCLGVFIDYFGHRISVLTVCGCGVFIAMCLAAFGPTVAGTAASLGIYAFSYSLGPTAIIDGLRTTIMTQDTFGAAYAIKICTNNAMNILVRIITGVIQDKDDDSYDHVVIVYVFLSAATVVVAFSLLAWTFFSPPLAVLQWTRWKRMNRGEELVAAREQSVKGERCKAVSRWAFGALCVLIVGSWVAYFWGVATGHNE